MIRQPPIVSERSRPNPGDTPGAEPKPWLGPTFRVEEKALYIFLWDGGAKNKFHWGLFLALNEKSGIVFQQLFSSGQWAFSMETTDVVSSVGLLSALKIGEIDDINGEWLKAIEACVRSSTVNESLGVFSSRTWALSAIYELADGGFISLNPDWATVRLIEEEAVRLAIDATAVHLQIVSQSQAISL